MLASAHYLSLDATALMLETENAKPKLKHAGSAIVPIVELSDPSLTRCTGVHRNEHYQGRTHEEAQRHNVTGHLSDEKCLRISIVNKQTCTDAYTHACTYTYTYM